MAEHLLDALVTVELKNDRIKEWFLGQFESGGPVTLEEFGIFFLNFIRQQTELYLKGNSTPTCFTPRKVSMSTNGQMTSTPLRDDSFLDDSLCLKSTPTPVNYRKKVRTSLANEFGTPKRDSERGTSFNSPCSPFANNSSPAGIRPNSFQLADFIVASNRSKKKSSKDSSNQQHSLSLCDKSNAKKSSEKPRRRIVPTALSKSAGEVAFASPAFRNENNILRIEESAVSRQLLRSQITEISKEIEETTPVNIRTAFEGKLISKPPDDRLCPVDLDKVTSKPTLDRLAQIYSLLIDLNVTTNILTELSYLLNILNSDEDTSDLCMQMQAIELDTQIDPKLVNKASGAIYTALKTLVNCVYFALSVLDKQRDVLALLDLQTLRVVLDNERLGDLASELKEFLSRIYSQKSRVEFRQSLNGAETSYPSLGSFNCVFFQQESDTRAHFPSDNEFKDFKRQRDMFYGVLKIWEAKHLNPTWDFVAELGGRIQSIFAQSDHPINMAHLSKLFVSQLIMSSSNLPTDLGFESVDLQKLNKLQQRLVAPSNFSTDYQFPGSQAFFKDFLLTANSVVFAEQVKIALTGELFELNESTFEVLSLSGDDWPAEEYVVRPDIVGSMRILAKFLALVICRPFAYEGARSSAIDKRQLELRSLTSNSSFDVVRHLKHAIAERKLLITLPWLVQFVSMLEPVTLQLAQYQQLIGLFFELYVSLDSLKLRPTSQFIIKSCLGWLFEHLNISSEYYSYRQHRSYLVELRLSEMQEVTVLVPKLNELMSLGSVVVTNVVTTVTNSQNGGHEIVCSIVKASDYMRNNKKDAKNSKMEKDTKNLEKSATSTSAPITKFSKTLLPNPLLESLLNVSCPFLADFRVAIMPTKQSKTVSRTGRYRHITTKLDSPTSSSSPARKSQDPRTKLIDAFLHSQSLSVRRTIEFVIERTTSAVIKDFQIEILLPSKAQAQQQLRSVTSIELKTVETEIREIYSLAFAASMKRWDDEISKNIEERAKKALDALLPNETHEMVKQTCLSLILDKCTQKTHEWRTTNLKGISFYSKDVRLEAEKMLKTNRTPKPPTQSTVLEIGQKNFRLSEVLCELQYLLHFTSTRPEFVTLERVKRFLAELNNCFEGNRLPNEFIRVVATMTVNLVQNLIERHVDIITDELIGRFVEIWKHDEMIAPQLANFESLITPAFIRSLSSNRNCYHKLATLLTLLIKADLLDVEFLNQRFVGLYKFDWPEDVLKQIAALLDSVVKETSPLTTSTDDDLREDGKSHLFLEMLADLARDVDQF